MAIAHLIREARERAGLTRAELARRAGVAAEGVRILVASLADVVRSKEAANREKDRMALPRLRDRTRREQEGEVIRQASYYRLALTLSDRERGRQFR